MPEPEAAAAKTLLGFREFPGTYGSVEFFDWNYSTAITPWKAAREALAKDADAALPE